MKSTLQKQVLLTLACSFFVAGFATGLNDLLVPHFKSIFSLDHRRAVLVPTCFFAAYLVISPLAGRFLRAWSARAGVLLSLVTMIVGAALFAPAAMLPSFELFLLGLFILASGGVLLQFFGNPYITQLAGAEASRTLTLVIAFTPLGTSLAGPLAGPWLFSNEVMRAQDLIAPYALMGVIMALMLVAVRAQKWPVFASEKDEAASRTSWWKVDQFRWGALAIFGYVGAEVGVGSFIVAASSLERYGAVTALVATKLVGLYWAGAMLGRFVGPSYMKRLGSNFCLGVHVLAAIFCLSVFMIADGPVALACLVAVGYCNSIMYPTITALSLRDSGPMASVGSAVLCTAVGGGALFPLLQGWVADLRDVSFSFVVPCLGYGMVLAFVVFCQRRKS